MSITGERIERESKLIAAAARRSEIFQEALGRIDPAQVQGLARVRFITEGAWTVKRPHLDPESSGCLDMLKLLSLSGLKSGSLVLVKLAQ